MKKQTTQQVLLPSITSLEYDYEEYFIKKAEVLLPSITSLEYDEKAIILFGEDGFVTINYFARI